MAEEEEEMDERKEFMQNQLIVPGVPKVSVPDGLRLSIWGGVLAGLVCGIIMRVLGPQQYSTREVMYIRLLGDLWLSAMRAVALPLFLITLVLSIYDMSIIACLHLLWQLIVVLVLLRVWMGVQTAVVARMSNAGTVTKPDRSVYTAMRVGEPPERNTPGQAVLDVLRNTFAENPVEALVQSSRMTYNPPEGKNQGEGDVFDYTKGNSVPVQQANLLGLVLWGIAVGMAMVLLRKQVQSLVLFVRVVADVAISLVEWLYLMATPFVLLCAAADVAGAYDVEGQYKKMWAYFWTVMVQLIIQMLVVYPVVTAVTAARRSKRVFAPWYLLWFTSESLILAGISSSSHVAYPLMLRALRRVQGIDTDAAAFVLSVMSVWLNDGTAIYLTTAGTWLAQDQNTYIIKDKNGYILAAVLSALGSISAAGESRMHPPLAVLVGAAMQADTTSVALAPIMHWDWLIHGCVSAVNISGAFFVAIILGYYALRRKRWRQDLKKPVNRPVPRPFEPERDEFDTPIKPTDEEVYPPVLEDPELDDLKDRMQVKKEKRRAVRAEKAAAKKQGQTDKAKKRASQAEAAAEEAERKAPP